VPDAKLFHIADVGAWVAAGTAGVYSGASLDTDGFIHLSTESQWLRVATTFYQGRADLVLLEIDPALLSAELRYDAVGSEKFPHLYGPLNVDAVVAVHDLEVGEDGEHFIVPTGVKGVAGPPAP